MNSGELKNCFVSYQPLFWDMFDQLCVLHNAVYPLLFERARTDFWRSLGFESYEDLQEDWPYYVVRNTVNYRKAVRRDSRAEIHVSVERIGESSLTFHHVMYVEGDAVADGDTTLVHVDADTGKPAPWSTSLRARLAPYVIPHVEP